MASAHSLRRDWRSQRSDQSILVNTVPLGSYLTGPIDYLKLDIEGMELEVMRSIAPHLHLVGALGLEFHGTGRQAVADEEELTGLLGQSGFAVSIARKSRSIFPADIGAWVARVQPYVSVIKAARTEAFGASAGGK